MSTVSYKQAVVTAACFSLNEIFQGEQTDRKEERNGRAQHEKK